MWCGCEIYLFPAHHSSHHLLCVPLAPPVPSHHLCVPLAPPGGTTCSPRRPPVCSPRTTCWLTLTPTLTQNPDQCVEMSLDEVSRRSSSNVAIAILQYYNNCTMVLKVLEYTCTIT